MSTQSIGAVTRPLAVAPAALPIHEGPVGPVTGMMLRRVYRTLAIIAALAAAIAALGGSGLDRLAAGMVLPGGGFFATGQFDRGVLALGLLIPAFLLWWGIGVVGALPAVWLGAAILAATTTPGTVEVVGFAACAAVGIGFLAAAAAARRVAWHRARARGRRLAGELDAVRDQRAMVHMPGPSGQQHATESSPEDLAALRYALDLALQPIDRWDGFSVLDQLREGALRYQLNMLGYALASAQHTRTPAFSGYLAEGQRMAIEKMLEPRTWRYWRWENLWGNLAWDPDPCARDNVMLSGYWGVQVGLYAALNGDDRYDVPGALTFRDRAEAYPWDFSKLAAQMRANVAESEYGLIPCEPHWIYPYCSSFALNTVVLEDRLGGRQHDAGGTTLARFRERFEQEFVRPDGRLITIRSRFGFSLPGSVVGGDALVAHWLNPSMPDVAQRTWWMTRQRIPQGGSALPNPGFLDRVDPGNYRVGNGALSRGAVALAARELGDEEVASAAEDWLQEHAPLETAAGATRHQDISVYGNLLALHARFSRADAMRDMINGPGCGRVGPRLAEASYPDVLVAHAVSDGDDLQLVLRPGAPGPSRQRLIVDRLVSGTTYRLAGATSRSVTADVDGSATFEVDLGGRLEVALHPTR